ncbi:Na+-driven multidrug efflux pump [Pricia antarctica]|uniref:Na+-driven multidrug efflux pump n=1 Tax=Pricia antarctica TaxID=641691 RepID=A0A1G6YQS7_9FLAO|nr:oligosaccharide flippase family protein [Pricia antarctica]SDD92393.1 Na+-driven multidrug efflux pump [Pricia antarctica]
MKAIERIKAILFKGNTRSVRVKKNVLLTILIKVAGMLIGFIYMPLSLDYLGQIKFGIFLTMLSIIDWFLNFDIGIGQGLRNKFGESVVRKGNRDAVYYVSTAYFVLGAIIAAVTVTLLILNFSLPWASWLNIPLDLQSEVKILGAIIIIAFGIRFIAGNIYEIFYAMQKMAYVEFFQFLSKATFLVFILLIPFIATESLLLFGAANSLTFALVPLIVGLYYFSSKFSAYRPSVKYVKMKYFKDLFSLSSKFFLIKIAMLIIHQTNNILIALFVSLESVPQYEAAYKYMSIFMLLFVILNNQLWPSNTEAYAKGDLVWMKKMMRALLKIWFATLVLATLMVVISPFVYELWFQKTPLYIPMAISISVAVSICLTTWVNMYNIVLNGTGKIKLQMYTWLFAAFINIPISLFLVEVIDLGVVGIVLGTVASLIPLAIVAPIQVNKILSKKDIGIWAK